MLIRAFLRRDMSHFLPHITHYELLLATHLRQTPDKVFGVLGKIERRFLQKTINTKRGIHEKRCISFFTPNWFHTKCRKMLPNQKQTSICELYPTLRNHVGDLRHFSDTKSELDNCKDHNSKDEWESLLSNDEKKQNIASIPIKRENIFTIPNLLSLSRIVLAPYIAYLVMDEQFALASTIFIIAGITDILDGQIARKWPSQRSAFGTALDPLGDKILITVLTISLTVANILPLPLTALIVGRDLLLIASVFYLRYRTCPPPVTLKRYFDPTLVNTKLNPTTISKCNTVLQVMVIWFAMTAPVFDLSSHPALYSLYAITSLTTIWSGLSYVFDKSTVQILKD